jgi:hypothetical protein
MIKSENKFLKEMENDATKEFLKLYELTPESKLTKAEKLELIGFIYGWMSSIMFHVEEGKKEYDQTLIGKVKNYATRIFS